MEEIRLSNCLDSLFFVEFSMRKLMAINMLSGFFLLFFCGLMGLFLRMEVVQQYVFSPGVSDSWRISLFRSSHAHGTLFALLQIVYGLSIPYSSSRKSVRIFQSIGIGIGAWVMSVLVFLESYASPSVSTWTWNQLCIGIGVSLWMIALASHGYGLAVRIWHE